MKAGLSRAKITPPLGTRLMGTSRRDGVGGCTGVHDDLFVRVLHLAAVVSASCHPSTACGFDVSADYPGAALAILDERLGEPVGELGARVAGRFSAGLTVPLGYANGQGLYLPVTHMLAEGGYEVESFYEYGLPAQLAEGAEIALARAFELLVDTRRTPR